MRLASISDLLEMIQRNFHLPLNEFAMMSAMTRDKHFGHLSGGISQRGSEYLTVYYEMCPVT